MNIRIDISNIKLDTERLVIRKCKKEELFRLYETQSIATSTQQLEFSLLYNNVFALVYKKNGIVIGTINLSNSPVCRHEQYSAMKVKDISYMIAEDYRGNGLATEAVRAVVDYCFEKIILDAITASHFAPNVQSKRVLEKCGFKFINQTFDKMNYILYAKNVPCN